MAGRISQVRQKTPPSGPEMVARGWDFGSGHRLRAHTHDEGQFEYAATGVMTVETPAGRFVVPPHRAVWLPPRTRHGVAMSGDVAMRTVYIRSDICAALPAMPCVVAVRPLLRELLVAAAVIGEPAADDARAARLFATLLDEVIAAPAAALALPATSHPALRAIAAALMATPADGRTLAEFARDLHHGERTLARLFVADTGMTFGQWRRQLRTMEAMRVLARGHSVTSAAVALGYGRPSAFIAMFRASTGTPPARWAREARRRHHASAPQVS